MVSLFVCLEMKETFPIIPIAPGHMYTHLHWHSVHNYSDNIQMYISVSKGLVPFPPAAAAIIKTREAHQSCHRWNSLGVVRTFR